MRDITCDLNPHFLPLSLFQLFPSLFPVITPKHAAAQSGKGSGNLISGKWEISGGISAGTSSTTAMEIGTVDPSLGGPVDEAD